jgi:ATP-binding cassette subfamily F protein 3
LRITCDELLLVADGCLTPFDGDLDDYPAWISQRAARRRQAASSDAGATGAEATTGGLTSAPSKKELRRREAEQRARLQPLRERLRRLERELDTLTEKRTRIDQQLADTALYEPEAKPRLLGLMDDKRQLDAELESVEHEWLSAGEALEQLQAQSL